MRQVELLSTGSYLPGDPIANEDMERLVGPLPDDVLEGIQVETRHWMVDPETGEHPINNSEMASKAAEDALDLAGIEAEEVDLLVLSTASPDYPLPPMVDVRAGEARARALAAIELRSGCAGRRRSDGHRAAVSRAAASTTPRVVDRQRGDLAAARARVPRQGSRQGPHARPA